jgi:hypothetical protein
LTIDFGKPGKYITTSTHNNTGVRGYYLVLPNRARHWIGESVYDAARDLEKVCTKYLSDEIGWDYWIDYCHGYDVKGNLHWANVDQSDIILRRAENI